MTDPAVRLDALAREHALDRGAVEQIRLLLGALEEEPDPHTTVSTFAAALDVHVADSLSGLAVPDLVRARRIADIGAGAGFPGLALAIALPRAQVDLIESAGRKAALIERLVRAAQIENARAVVARAEEWAAAPRPLGRRGEGPAASPGASPGAQTDGGHLTPRPSGVADSGGSVGAGAGAVGGVEAGASGDAGAGAVGGVEAGASGDAGAGAVGGAERGGIGPSGTAVRAAGIGGREAYDVVTARAVGSLALLAEYAAPLLAMGGVLVAWKGARDPEEERAGAAAAGQVGLDVEDVLHAVPFAGAEHRHLHVMRKIAPTPAGYPRRPGMARKRPLA